MGELQHLTEELRTFIAERDWAKFHDPKNLSMLVASEAGELLALFRWVHNSEADAFCKQTENRKKVEAEVGDVAISLLLLCDRLGIDMIQAAREKLEVNRRNYPPGLARGQSEREK